MAVDINKALAPLARDRLALGLVTAMAAVTLAACGGGGSGNAAGAPVDAGPTSPPAPSAPSPAVPTPPSAGTPVAPPNTSPSPSPSVTPAPTHTDFWVAGIAGPNDSRTGRSRIYVVDPANLASPLLVRDIADKAGIGIGLQWLDPVRRRPVSPSTDIDFVEGGTVRHISLRRSRRLVESQLSSVSDACATFGSRVRHWAVETELDFNLQNRQSPCPSLPNSGSAFSHFAQTLGASDPAPAMAWSTAAIPLLDVPNRRVILFDPRPAAGSTTPGSFDLHGYRADGTSLGISAGGAGLATNDWTALLEAEAGNSVLVQFGFASTGTKTVRRLTWTTGGSTLSAPIHTATASILTSVPSAGRTYLADGTAVLAIDHGASAVQRIATMPNSDPYWLFATGSTINALAWNSQRCPTPSRCATLYSTPHGGGTTVERHFNWSGTSVLPYALLVDHDRNLVLLVLPTGAGLYDTKLVNLDTGEVSPLAGGVKPLGTVEQNGPATGYDAASVAILYCVPMAGSTSCSGRPLIEHRILSGTQIDHGSLPGGMSRNPLFALGDGIPAAVNISITGENSHLYLMTAGQAASLKFIGTGP